jgi:hypothetical protein
MCAFVCLWTIQSEIYRQPCESIEPLHHPFMSNLCFMSYDHYRSLIMNISLYIPNIPAGSTDSDREHLSGQRPRVLIGNIYRLWQRPRIIIGTIHRLTPFILSESSRLVQHMQYNWGHTSWLTPYILIQTTHTDWEHTSWFRPHILIDTASPDSDHTSSLTPHILIDTTHPNWHHTSWLTPHILVQTTYRDWHHTSGFRPHILIETTHPDWNGTC